MNSTLHHPQDDRSETDPPVFTAAQLSREERAERKALVRQLRAERIIRWLSRSPFFQPFCHVLGPAVHWLLQPTNSVIAGLFLILSPFIGLILLPLFLILIPACLGIAVIAIIANSMKLDNDDEDHPSFASHVIH